MLSRPQVCSQSNAAGDTSKVAQDGLFLKKGMILPFTPLSMSFYSVNYFGGLSLGENLFIFTAIVVHLSVANAHQMLDVCSACDRYQEMKELGVTEDRLHRKVTGAFRPGILSALMGVSGAGKTTLLDVPAARKTGGYVEGDIRTSGFPKKQETRDRTKEELTIAVELVANPSIIFMDEPTSGLDAREAAIIMRTRRSTGQVIYPGPFWNNSHKVVEYFEAIPAVPKIREKQNPAAWMLEASSGAAEVRLGIDFAERYKSSSLYQHHAVLGMFNVDPEKYRYWIRVGALLGFIILFNVLITFSLVYT
ncbi:hypothetical protein JRO89_XS09G0184700 [Xanthoceras sorbifolium]|uniref:Plant PDR ABC transporter associated domain-containing protein n=1 Tax=Xanthoceras sorbifolium TaxID=99658 RepID=A0ABQ8HLU6_9ROSI|nr:hypothetical protein JRO89_XS09G0184700 [Xanthoceras sorbifolium]